MIHERFNLDEWVKKYPLADFPLERRKKEFAGSLTGPVEVALIEQMGEQARAKGYNLGKPRPTDLCIWNLGDSQRREVTKIGGVPYWPAWEPWPTLDDGQPFTFVAQFCFADSRDILPDLPGEILSMLVEQDDYQYPIYYWFNLGETNLLAPEDMPEPAWQIQPCHATLHRTADYPDYDWEAIRGDPTSCVPYFDQATKLAGAWDVRGELPDPKHADTPEYKKELEQAWEDVRRSQREFICQLHSLEIWDKTWPFVNAETERAAKAGLTGKLLMMGDVGVRDVFYNRQTGEIYDDFFCG